MGIRFSCHICNHGLHVKDFQAGKRGRCPQCNGSFRIPKKDSPYSIAIDDWNPVATSTTSSTASETKRSRSSGSIDYDTNVAVADRSERPQKSKKSESKATSSQTNSSQVNTSATTGQKTSNTNNGSSSPLPPSLAKAGDANWFVRPPSGGQYGPASSSLLSDWILERRVTADSFLWYEGMAQWQLASVLVPEYFANEQSTNGSTMPPVVSQFTTTEPKSSLDSLLQDDPLTAPETSVASVRGATLLKKRRQRKQQWMIVSVLGVASLLLLSVLVVVLIYQFSGK